LKNSNENDLVLDGDLPKKDWFTGERSPLLSEKDGEFHTVVPGRPIGLHPYNVEELAKENIHLHFYGDFTQGQWTEWIEKTHKLAPGFLHIHPNVDQENWIAEFSQYDAGWLHFFQSEVVHIAPRFHREIFAELIFFFSADFFDCPCNHIFDIFGAFHCFCVCFFV